ncbi:glycosyltransferase, exosortase A system-associated [Aestuariirhabdus sp. Z084]|uniref:TIGR04063 family PEP-CTERM/XrtA system glycosyltransferase n=1 Tax=Aestuariirhabdus haliotis TaxID=2918751 RepID=UPI00201B422F|nr:TIGR04063 family PEP-CTERM/XrtA system glycosyltransferase [Aestuariirhabdus haliotis]MCL6414685.1 glycosyltransferase, exosortase A system-associated [Aestuariirhabdus haliotis]MCL6418617.1 glycosyltransferase, exosortase A system-associated [Aestuariirhabdus haliotis]
MKVLHVFDHSIPLHSGYTFRSRSIINCQRLQGITTCHITGSKQGIHADVANSNPEIIEGLPFYRCPAPPSWIAKNRILQQLYVVYWLIIGVYRAVSKEQPDLIHAHSPALNGFCALLVGKLRRIPVVYEIRAFWEDAAVDNGSTVEGGFRYRLSQWFEEWVVKRADGVITICNGLMNDLEQRVRLPDYRAIVPNAVDVEKYPDQSENLRRRWQSPEYVPTVGFIGSFYRYEGLDILLEAIDRLKKRNVSVKLLLIGGGPEESYLKTLVQRYGLERVVEMPGRVPHNEVDQSYERIDILAYPRRSMRLTETVTPLKPLEAMSMGRPLILSDVGGHKELVSPESGAEMFPSENVEALAESIERLIRRLQRDNAMDWLTSARRLVAQEKSWKASVDNCLPLYHKLVGQG